MLERSSKLMGNFGLICALYPTKFWKMNEPPVPQPNTTDHLDAVSARLSNAKDADVFLYSAGMLDSTCGKLINLVRSIPVKRPNAILILTTNGGSADSAYQLARTIKQHYSSFHLYIFGYCKSAGTLVAVAADEIVMSEFGQFGPLDVQFADKTEMFGQTAALDVNQALQTISEAAFNFSPITFLNLGRVAESPLIKPSRWRKFSPWP